jgi:hypothetical protein
MTTQTDAPIFRLARSAADEPAATTVSGSATTLAAPGIPMDSILKQAASDVRLTGALGIN